MAGPHWCMVGRGYNDQVMKYSLLCYMQSKFKLGIAKHSTCTEGDCFIIFGDCTCTILKTRFNTLLLYLLLLFSIQPCV